MIDIVVQCRNSSLIWCMDQPPPGKKNLFLKRAKKKPIVMNVQDEPAAVRSLRLQVHGSVQSYFRNKNQNTHRYAAAPTWSTAIPVSVFTAKSNLCINMEFTFLFLKAKPSAINRDEQRNNTIRSG